MANTDRAVGLKVAGPLLGATWYSVSSAYATVVFIGDPVVATGTSNLVNVATAGSTNAILGAVIGVYDTNKTPGCVDSVGNRVPYRPASTTAYVLVADCPQQLFIAQGDGDTSYFDVNDCGGNVPMVAGSGVTMTGVSGWELDDSATAGSTAAEQIRLVRPVDRVDNTVGSANCDWYCFINNHQKLQGIVGAGV